MLLRARVSDTQELENPHYVSSLVVRIERGQSRQELGDDADNGDLQRRDFLQRYS